MPLLTTTIEDNSPLITYTSQWIAGSSANDSLLDQYSASAFTLTFTSGATATFTFNGTGITLFGAKRGNHGTYQVTIDSVKYQSQNGSVPDPGDFQVALFQATGLTQGQHDCTLQYTDVTGRFLDLDFITWEGNVGETDGNTLYVNSFQDSDPAFTYDSLWSENPANIGTFSGANGHVASSPGATATFTFQGDGVALYGPVSPSGAPYTVQVDGGQAQLFASNRPHYTPQMLLYQATNLGLGQHQLKVTYSPAAVSSQVLAIDYANVYTTVNNSNSSTTSGATLSTTSGAAASSRVVTNGLSTGPVVGIAIGSFVAGVIFLGALIFLLRRRGTKDEPVDEKLLVKPFNTVQATLAPVNDFSPTTSDRSLDPRRQSPTFPFMTETRKGQPAFRYVANPGERYDHVSTSSISYVQTGGRDTSVQSTNPNATTSRVADEAFPPDYDQATG